MAKRGAPAAATELLLARWPAGALPEGAVVTWVPAHPRRALRAPDAGQALAAALAGRDGLEARALLARSVWSRRQAGRTDEARARAPERLGLRTRGGAPELVVLLDDVRTTGTTLDRAAALLHAAGAERVDALTIAAAPRGGLPGGPPPSRGPHAG